jgi:hypothetical protein
MQNSKEFRVVVDNIRKYTPNPTRAANFTDYYLSRNQRVRHFTKCIDITKANKWFLITSKPGMRVKKHEEINVKEAKKLIISPILILRKRGVGHLVVDEIEGYAERVIALMGKSKKPFLDEVQIEFEVSLNLIEKVVSKLKPLKVIKVGLFDYVTKIRK